MGVPTLSFAQSPTPAAATGTSAIVFVATPKGPPPRRSVLGGSVAGRTSSEGRGGATAGFSTGRNSAAHGSSLGDGQAGLDGVDDETARGAVRRRSTALESGLTHLLECTDRRPTVLTKEAAAEWRESVEFQVALKRRLGTVQVSDSEFTFAAFLQFARDHIDASARRRSSGRCEPPPPRERPNLKTAVASLFVLVRGLLRKRLAAGLGSLLPFRRQALRESPRTGADSDIFRDLLISQCQSAEILEKRVKIAGRAGGIASCLARLQRAELRRSWTQWSQLFAPSSSATSSVSTAAPVVSSASGGSGRGVIGRTNSRQAGSLHTGPGGVRWPPQPATAGHGNTGGSDRSSPGTSGRPWGSGGPPTSLSTGGGGGRGRVSSGTGPRLQSGGGGGASACVATRKASPTRKHSHSPPPPPRIRCSP